MVEKSKLEDQSDEELMEMYRMEKDQTSSRMAFEVLFKRHSGRVSGYLKKRLSNSKEAQDLVQEVFLKLHRSRHQYNSSLPFSPWLFSVCFRDFAVYLILRTQKSRKVSCRFHFSNRQIKFFIYIAVALLRIVALQRCNHERDEVRYIYLLAALFENIMQPTFYCEELLWTYGLALMIQINKYLIL